MNKTNKQTALLAEIGELLRLGVILPYSRITSYLHRFNSNHTTLSPYQDAQIAMSVTCLVSESHMIHHEQRGRNYLRNPFHIT